MQTAMEARVGVSQRWKEGTNEGRKEGRGKNKYGSGHLAKPKGRTSFGWEEEEEAEGKITFALLLLACLHHARVCLMISLLLQA
jgi:hypothetical protein